MIAGYSNYPGAGSTPPKGIEGFEFLFTKGKELNSEKTLKGIDALLLWGGADIGTALYQEKPVVMSVYETPSSRDLFEWELVHRAVKSKIPIIGVCRGAQLLCAYAGGKLAQDVTGHHYPHSVKTYENVIFEQVSSSHHQMMYPFSLDDEEYQLLASTTNCLSGGGYRGLSDDEVADYKEFMEPEVIYFNNINAMAIQSHPEWHTSHDFNNWLEIEILCRLYGENKL